MKYVLEICAGSIRSAFAAQEGGADRIELCDNLCEGGTTPSYGMIKTCLSQLNIPVFPIIRPRGGDFVYSNAEFEVMKQDVLACRELGCKGLVLGMLSSDGSVDKERVSELVELSGPMQLTFHRAFDRCSDRTKALKDIIELGFHRILTSGGEEYAADAISELTLLNDQANNRIIIMPGSGIKGQNLAKIAEKTGAVEFHSTAKTEINHITGNSKSNNLDAQYIYQTDAAKVAEMREILNRLEGD